MRLYNHQSKPYLLLLPALIFLAVLVLYGVSMAFLGSLQPVGEEMTGRYYHRLWLTPDFWYSLYLSLKIAVFSTVPALVLGTLLARMIYRYARQSFHRFWVLVPMLMPHFVAAYLVLMFLAPSGWFSGLLHYLHLVESPGDFPVLVNDRAGVGIILTYLWKEIPFVVLMVLPVYYHLNPQYEQVVRTLGGGGWDVFKAAEWPWIVPVLLEAGVIIIAFILAAYEVPHLLGVTYPKMLPVLAYQWFYEGDWSNRPLALAAMMTVTMVLLGLAYGTFRVAQKQRYRLMRGR